MSNPAQLTLLKGKKRRLEFRADWSRRAVSYSHFPIWQSGGLLEVPVQTLRRAGGTWLASGRTRTKLGTWRVSDTLKMRGNTLVIDREWRWRGGRLPSVRLGFDLDVPFRKLDHWAIPYISMNGNEGAKTVPTGMTDSGHPWWFREERTTAPGLMTLESGGLVAGAYTEPGRSEQTLCSCCIMPGRSGHTLRIFYPFREAPRTYLGHASWARSRDETGLYTCGGGAAGFIVDGKATFRRKFFVVLDRAGERRHGYVRVWESAWRNLREPMAAPVPVKQTEDVLWRSMDHFWVQRGKVRGYAGRVDPTGKPHHWLAIGWCQPTPLLAWLAIRKAIRTGHANTARRAIHATEFFVENAGQKSGAFLTHYDLAAMQWRKGDLNAVQMGGAAYWLLRCVELLRTTTLFRRRIRADRWADFALRFCDLVVRTQRADGAPATYWTIEGEPAGFERAMGVHAARAVLQAYCLTGKAQYLRAAERAADFYAVNMIDREQGYGDCTDIHSATTENDAASVPDFFIDLYRITGTKRYLDKAVRAAEYCLAFMFTYNVYFPPYTDSGRRGMRTRGFPTISAETAFVCWMLVLQANAFLELWKETRERRWRDYAIAVIRASLQMMSEPGDTFGLADDMIGLRAEVIAVLDTIKDRRIWKQGMTHYTWDHPVWWPAALNLLSFAVVEDRFPEVVKLLERSS